MECVAATLGRLPSLLPNKRCTRSSPLQPIAFLPSSLHFIRSYGASSPPSQLLLAAIFSISASRFPSRLPALALVYAGPRSSSQAPPQNFSRGNAPIKRTAERVFTSVAPPDSLLNGRLPVNFGRTLVITVAVLVVAVVAAVAKPGERASGSVADLVKRGQLRSNRRSDSRPLKYEDPFNNPMVKMGERNSLVKMYGKQFRLQPVTLTEEKMLSHQNRRVHAYQWKRPTVFLIEGAPIPEGTDPDSVRWIPSNHPFATAKDDIDEVAAERNVYQTRGVPSRVRAEHEALRKKMMEAAERETDLQLPMMYPGVSGDQGNRTPNPSPAQHPEKGLGSRCIKPFDKHDETGLGVRSIKPFEKSDEDGLGGRSIKPFEKPDGDITAIVNSPNADSGPSSSDGRLINGQIVG